MPLNHRQHRLETMEDRHMMSSIGLFDGELRIEGSSHNDTVTVSEIRQLDWSGGGLPRVATYIRASVAEPKITRTATFRADLVDDIVANLGAGDDDFTNNTGKESTVRGGTGDDILRGGRARDVMFGENGNDTLYGRAGDDVLDGGNHNDGLFGGQGYDLMIGRAGVDRFLRDTSSTDRVLDPRNWDATIYFDPGGYVDERVAYGDKARNIFYAGRWTDSDIELVDSALKALHDQTGNDTLLEQANGSALHFIRHGRVTDLTGELPYLREGSGDYKLDTEGERIRVFVGGYNEGEGRIAFSDDAFAEGEDILRQSVFHEIAHNFDERNEHSFATRPLLDAFRNVSEWQRLHVGQQTSADEYRTGDGNWAYTYGTFFVDDYGKENPLEDFATTFAAYFMGSDYRFNADDVAAGVTDGRQLAPLKFAILDQMFSQWD